MRSRVVRDATLDDALREVLATSVEALAVERAALWNMRPDRSALELQLGYERTALRWTRGEVRERASAYAHFDALESAEIAPVPELGLLDVPVRVEGALVAVLRHEHGEGARRWTLDETRFAL